MNPARKPDFARNSSRGKAYRPVSAIHGPSGNLRRADRELRRARTLDDKQIARVLAHIQATSNSPASDELKFLLSVFAGLRCAEIAGLTLEAMVDADDRISPVIVVGRHIGKGGRQRMIPMHPSIRQSLVRFRKAHPDVRFLSFSCRRGVRRQSADALKAWFSRIYAEVGLQGCSSHSGRRTFITNLSRMANLHGGSLRDVQLLAGHARLETTSAYIDPSDNLGALIAALGNQPPQAPGTAAREGEDA